MSEGPYTDAEKGNMPFSELASLSDANGGLIYLQHDTAVAWATQVARNSALTISPLGAYRTTAQSDSIGATGQSHGYGTCIDIWATSANQWAISNFPSTWVRDLWLGGSTRQDASHEWNHWHYIGPITVAGTATTLPKGELDMATGFIRNTSGAIYVLESSTGKLRSLTSDEWAVYTTLGYSVTQSTDAAVNQLISTNGLQPLTP